MSNGGNQVFAHEMYLAVKILRDEKDNAKAFRCCICGKVHRGHCLIYRVFLGDIVKLTMKACDEHFPDLEARTAGLQLQIEDELEGFLGREVYEFLATNCLE